MTSAQNITAAALAGIAIVGGAVYMEGSKLGLSFGGIHSVDFRNSQIEVVGTACADPQLTAAGVATLPLHEGSYQLGQYQFELVGDVRYGDVSGHTGDNNSEKAVFVGSCASAGKTSQVLFVYGMMDGKAKRLATTDLSGSGDTLVQSYSVGDGAIRVQANQGDPPSLVTLTFALLNGSLVNLNPSASPKPVETALENADSTASDNAGLTDASSAIQVDSIDYRTFHDALSPYGQWMQHPRWGTVWHPTEVTADFSPYRQGHWEDTGEYGTVWVSNYRWGDIAFHYGRWGYDPSVGWLWQPGYVWSPAWVAWREGEGNIGWFPIPPNYYGGTGAFADDWDGWYGYRALYGASLDPAAYYALWNFVPADDIYAPSIGIDIIAAGTYAGFIGRTVGWTRFGVVRGHLSNRAIDPERFRAAFHHPIPVGTRHDFASRHVPVVGVRQGHLIGMREASLGHPSADSFRAHHLVGGSGMSTTGFAHHYSRAPAFSRYGISSREGFVGERSHSYGAGMTHRSEFVRPTASRGFGGSSQHSGFGGGAETERRGFGGESASRPAFGGGAYAQRPANGGGVEQQQPQPMQGGAIQRPAFGGGQPAFSRPMQAPQRPANAGNTRPRH